MTNDILRALDDVDVSVLTLLSLSSAFDATDHFIVKHSVADQRVVVV